MEKTNQLRIAITGPESTGKSSLAKMLTKHYKMAYIPEYARFFLRTKQSYTFEDVTYIAKQQFDSINYYDSPILIADTELIVTKIWQQYKYQKVDPWIEKHIKKQHFDIYLLMDIDMEWTFDPLRENPSISERKDLLNLYKKELQSQEFNYELISGQGKNRLNNALAAIKKYSKK
jgi:nicotinamide riboside kinase